MAAHQPQPPSIWTQMSYTPPRGPCKHSHSILQTCACFRFMVHPLKAASSFNCDGCGHHACFHHMENPVDDEAALKWSRRRSRPRVNDEQVKEDEVEEGWDDYILKDTIGNKTKRRRITNEATTGSTPKGREVVTVDLVAPDSPSKALGKRQTRAQEKAESCPGKGRIVLKRSSQH